MILYSKKIYTVLLRNNKTKKISRNTSTLNIYTHISYNSFHRYCRLKILLIKRDDEIISVYNRQPKL